MFLKISFSPWKSLGLPTLKKFTKLRLLTRLLPTSVGPFTRRNWFAVGWPVGSPGRKSGFGDQGRCPNGSMIFSGKAWSRNESPMNVAVSKLQGSNGWVFTTSCICWYFLCRKKWRVVFASQKVLWWKFNPFCGVCVSLNFATTPPTKNNGAFDTPCRWWPFPIEFERFADPKIAHAGVFEHFPGNDRCTTRHSLYFLENVFFQKLHFEEVGFPMLGFNDLMYCVVSKMGNAWFVFMLGNLFPVVSMQNTAVRFQQTSSRTLCLIHTTWVFRSTC